MTFNKVKLDVLEEDIRLCVEEHNETEEIKKYLSKNHCHLWIDKNDIENIEVKDGIVTFWFKDNSKTSNQILARMRHINDI